MPAGLESLVLDQLPGAVLAVDLDDRVTVWNAAAERLFGWPAAEVLGRPIPVVPLDQVAARRALLARARDGEDVEAMTQRVHRDGRRLDVMARFAAIRDQDGRVSGWLTAFRDASFHVQTVTRLERSQAELELVRRLASLVQEVLQDLDVNSVLQSVVEAGVDLVDGDAGSVCLQDTTGGFYRVVNINIPSDLTAHPVAVGKGLHGTILRTGAPLRLDDYDTWAAALPGFKGRGFHAALCVPIFRAGSVMGSLAVHSREKGRLFPPESLDVLVVLAQFASVAIGNASVYRRVSGEREKFLALVQAMPDGLAVVEGGAVTAWNAAAVRLTGQEAEDVIGREPPLDLAAAAAGIEIGGTADGPRWVQTVASQLPEGEGTVYLLRDVTEQRDLERAKDLFFATTSHELKTPLTVVKGLASTLRKHWDRMDERQRDDSLATIERRSEALDRLIERILVGSRVQAGALEITPTPIDIAPLIDGVVPGFAATSPDHDIRVELPGSLPLVAGDRQAVDTILGHLLENAIKYSPGGGEIIVRASVAPPLLRVEVLDRGIGVHGSLDRLLAPFVQADSEATRRFGGVGLGLYIVRRLLDQLGGDLWAESRDGGGAVFGFSLDLWR